jgi:hypothetical protein
MVYTGIIIITVPAKKETQLRAYGTEFDCKEIIMPPGGIFSIRRRL